MARARHRGRIAELVGDWSLDGKMADGDKGKYGLPIRALFRTLSFTFPHIHIFEYLDMFLRKSAKEKARRLKRACLVSL
jgi:hypothetical protein